MNDLPLEHYYMMREDAYLFAMTHLVPGIVKKLLELTDPRSLLQLHRYNGHSWTPTAASESWHRITGGISAKAQCQMANINNAGYNINENLAMMLEQGDYWKDDLYYLIKLAEKYLEGAFDK